MQIDGPKRLRDIVLFFKMKRRQRKARLGI